MFLRLYTDSGVFQILLRAYWEQGLLNRFPAICVKNCHYHWLFWTFCIGYSKEQIVWSKSWHSRSENYRWKWNWREISVMHVTGLIRLSSVQCQAVVNRVGILLPLEVLFSPAVHSSAFLCFFRLREMGWWSEAIRRWGWNEGYSNFSCKISCY